jgi:aspartate 1-decarboxylase
MLTKKLKFMYCHYLKAKIHRATVTDADLNYVGSITIAEDILELSGIHEYEKVQVVNINNGKRIETYTIKGKSNSGIICLNGAAARYFEKGDIVIIMAYCILSEEEKKDFKPKVVVLDNNIPVKVGEYYNNGLIK